MCSSEFVLAWQIYSWFTDNYPRGGAVLPCLILLRQILPDSSDSTDIQHKDGSSTDRKKVLPACPSIHNSHSQRLAVSQSIRTDDPPTSHSPCLKRFSPLHTIIYSLQNLCCPYTNIASVGEIYYLCSAAGYSARSQGAGRWSRWGGRSQILLAEVGKTGTKF